MVDPALQSAIEAMSVDERLELAEFIESTVDQSEVEMADEKRAIIRSRADELQADPSVGLPWDELGAQVGSRWA
ncbi:MAG: addiction module protein [Nocardioidaceae bacterium]